MKRNELSAMIMLSCDALSEGNLRLYEEAGTSGTKRPKSLDRRVKRYAARERRRKEYASFYKFGRNFLTCLLVACTVSFASVMSVDAVRAELHSIIITWYEQYFMVKHITPEATDDKNGSEAKEAPKLIEEKREPMLIPTGLTREVLIDGKTKYIIDYLGGDTLHLSFAQYTTNLNSSFDAEHIKEIKDAFVGDNEAIFISFTDDPIVYLSWSDGEYVYELSDYDGIYSEELLIAMAESVK